MTSVMLNNKLWDKDLARQEWEVSGFNGYALVESPEAKSGDDA